jgi:hypothetical protein
MIGPQQAVGQGWQQKTCCRKQSMLCNTAGKIGKQQVPHAPPTPTTGASQPHFAPPGDP